MSITSILYSEENFDSLPNDGLIKSLTRTVKLLLPLVKPVYGQLIAYRLLIYSFTALLLRFLLIFPALFQPYVIKRLIDNVFIQRDPEELLWCFASLSLLPIIQQILFQLRTVSDASVEKSIDVNLTLQVYEHVQRLQVRFFLETSSGELLSRITTDVYAIYRASMEILTMMSNMIRFAVAFTTLLSLEWRLALISFASFPLWYYVILKLAMWSRNKTKEFFGAIDQVHERITESLSIESVMLTKVFGREKHIAQKLRVDMEKEKLLDARGTYVMNFVEFAIQYSVDFNKALIYYIGGQFLFKEYLTLGTLILFTQYLDEVYTPMTELLNTRVTFIKNTVQVERVLELLHLPIEIKDPEVPVTLICDDGTSNIQGDVELDSVSLDYSLLPPLKIEASDRMSQPTIRIKDQKASNKKRDWALNNLSIKFKAGTMNAIVGKSGAGKSTMLKLIHRLYDPTQGLVKLDGIDIRQLKLEELIGFMGVVSQESYFFNDSVKANLLFAKPDATDEEIERACKAANIWDFIQSLEKKLEETIGESGYKLSGGERQRLSIARTILKNPKIILLDEATSHLDSENENLIKEALDSLFVNRTSIVIAHRLSTIIDASQIIVMEDGAVVESGTHQELLALNGHYKSLYDAQFSKTG